MEDIRWLAVSGLVLVSAISFACPASAQVGMIVSSSDIFTSDPSNPGSPYTAEYKITTVRKLANGATITQTQKTVIARDPQGRTHSELALGLPEDEEEKMITVFDPVARTITSWETFHKEARVSHLPPEEEIRAKMAEIRDRAKAAQEKPDPPVSSSSSSKPVTAAAGSSPQAIQEKGMDEGGIEQGKEEPLGSKTINGILAAGTRTTSTIPKGKIGNDQPLTSTHEIWFSNELKLSVLEIEDDPNSGTMTRELVKLDRNEPDPALFRVPEGYTVKDVQANQ
jgi:hypothetical protein